jgi:hypothetical protein
MDDPREIERIRRRSLRVAIAVLGFGLLMTTVLVALYILHLLTDAPGS